MPRDITEDPVALHWRRTKIIATLGPACASAKTVEKLIRAGANLFRINMSHGSHEEHRELFELVRHGAKRLDQHIPVIFDLCGPKIRVGEFESGAITLRRNQQLTITTRKVTGRDKLIPSQYRKLHLDVAKNERILLDDGRLELQVKAVAGRDVHCRVIHGGTLQTHKGMNLPDTRLSVAALTKKDREDVDLAIELGADFLALSFVRCVEDIRRLRRYMKGRGADIPIIAKIEKPEAVENIASIIEHSYAIMVARGDLGIELPAEKVPLIQRELIQLARCHHKPVIVATQMLESMITNPRPTRAEVGDVATAASLSTDAVMLSGETAAGRFPVSAVEAMERVLREIEHHQWRSGYYGEHLQQDPGGHPASIRMAVAHAVNHLTHELKLQAIIIPTRSGATASVIAANRPTAPSLGICADARICRRLALHWGVVPIRLEEDKTNKWRKLAVLLAKRYKLTRTGKNVLLVSGFNEDPRLNEPTMKLIQL